MILALVDHITPRHRYIFEFMFRDILGLDISLTESREEFAGFDSVKFQYGVDEQQDGTIFFSSGLLKEKGLHPSLSDNLSGNETPSQPRGLHPFAPLFPVENGGSLPFDPFSAAFYVLTRMEEYLPFEPDAHGRFTEKESLQYATGLLQEPVVNQFAFMVLDALRKQYPGLEPTINYNFLPTIDVDIAFAHLGKQPLRALGGYVKLLLKGDLHGLKERWRVVHRQLPDPYDNFDLHLELAKQYGTGLIYFFLLGNYGKYDKMLSHRNRHFRELIKKVSGEAETGIHPSYASFGKREQVKLEMERLEEITGNPVEKHRAHFLRLKFPDTFRDLVALGIKEDHSLGYSTVNGFRAGTANPFYFYDVLKDEKTGLLLRPFIFMDSAMIDHSKMGPDEGWEEVSKLLEKVRRYGGEAAGIWHNYSLSEKGQYRGWQQLFRNVMKTAAEKR